MPRRFGAHNGGMEKYLDKASYRVVRAGDPHVIVVSEHRYLRTARAAQVRLGEGYRVEIRLTAQQQAAASPGPCACLGSPACGANYGRQHGYREV